MSAYQSQPLPTVAYGDYRLQRTVGEHLYPGEPMIGAWAVELDRLLPLYWDRDTIRAVGFAPVVWAQNFLKSLWRGLWLYFLPRWFVDLFGPSRYGRRPYGLSLTRRAYRALRRPLHGGGSWRGPEGSTAWMFWRAVRTTVGEKLKADHDLCTLLVTDRRMLVLSRWHGFEATSHYRATPLLELPLGSWWPRPDTPNDWLATRQDLLFADGSWLALAFANDQDRDAFRGLTAGR